MFLWDIDKLYVYVSGRLERAKEQMARRREWLTAGKKLMGIPSSDSNGLEGVLQIATASLSTLDRRVGTQAMDARMLAAAGSRAPRCQI
jgi:hypothetical protein